MNFSSLYILQLATSFISCILLVTKEFSVEHYCFIPLFIFWHLVHYGLNEWWGKKHGIL